jgi:dTDP-4-dehydrorhamnose 3,5-epimerase
VKFIETPICGLWLIELEPTFDERGFFARSFCEDEFRRIGLVEKFPQQNVSFNAQAGIIRGLHFQKSPYEEIKTVRCVRGEIFDVTVDLRPESASFGKTFCHILK